MPTPTPTPTARPSIYRWVIHVLAIVLVGILVYRFSHEHPSSDQGRITSVMPKKLLVPNFSLTERSGKVITNKDLQGKIWVADFVYTTCPGPCPVITANMAKVQDAVANDPHVQLVSFTVDPQTDTPPVLAAYADKFKADPNRWWFLTGPEKPLYDLIQNGFYQAVEDNRGKPLTDGQFTVTHSTYFVLVDADGYLRNWYEGVGGDGKANLLKAIKTLESEEKQ
jgi:protein SCO1